MDQPYTISPARYAKGKLVVRVTPDGSGFKTRAGGLIEALPSRYARRSRGYIVSPATAARFEKLYAEGWGGSVFSGELLPPDAHPLCQAQCGVVVDIGQLTDDEKRELSRAVRKGTIAKWRGHWAPVPGAVHGMGPLKTCYGPVAFAQAARKQFAPPIA